MGRYFLQVKDSGGAAVFISAPCVDTALPSASIKKGDVALTAVLLNVICLFSLYDLKSLLLI